MASLLQEMAADPLSLLCIAACACAMLVAVCSSSNKRDDNDSDDEAGCFNAERWHLTDTDTDDTYFGCAAVAV